MEKATRLAEKTTKLSLEELKAKAGKAFVNAGAINGGMMADCHIETPDTRPVCDNV